MPGSISRGKLCVRYGSPFAASIIARCEHEAALEAVLEAVLEAMQERLDQQPDAMRLRRQTVEPTVPVPASPGHDIRTSNRSRHARPDGVSRSGRYSQPTQPS